MTVYTVHIRQPVVDLDAMAKNLILVPERFSFAAVLLGPIWLLFHQLWVSFLLWIASASVILTVLILGNSIQWVVGAYFLGALLLGLEANALRRRELQFRGYHVVDLTSGNSKEESERRYLDRAFKSYAEDSPDSDPNFLKRAHIVKESSIGGLIDIRGQS